MSTELSSLSNQYVDYVVELNNRLIETNKDCLTKLAPIIGKSIAEDGILHTFGSGHSSIIAREIVHRAGGLVPVSNLCDPTGGWAEVIPQFGEKLIQKHHTQYEFKEAETLIVISNSGINPSPIDVALTAKNFGLNVVVISSVGMSSKAESRHPSGKKLFEVADYVLDNLGETGDAVLPIDGMDLKTGPMSTFSGSILMNLLVLEVINWMKEKGYEVPLLQSANTPGGRERNIELAQKYKARLCRPI